MALADVADPAVLPQPTALFEANIAAGSDAIGVGVRRTADGIRFDDPVSIIACERGR